MRKTIGEFSVVGMWPKGITVGRGWTGGSSLGGAAHVLDYVGPCEIEMPALGS